METSVLRLPAVRARTGLGKTSIYQAIREHKFPPPIRLGDRAVGWLESEIVQWLNDRVEKSRGTEGGNA